MDNIALRIKELIEFKKMNISSFEKKIGAGNNSIGTLINRNSNVSGQILSKILNTFEDVSSDWLLTGKGDMLRSSNQNLQPVATNQDNEDVVLLKQHIKLLNKQIEELTGDQNKMSVQSMVEFLYDEAKKRSILEDLETLERMVREKKKETNGK